MKTVSRPSVKNQKGHTKWCNLLNLLERDTGLEPATFALARQS
jgi:hypothetical protein